MISPNLKFKELTTAIFESTNDSIVVSDHEGKIVLLNNAAVKLFGYSADEAVGDYLNIIIPEVMHKSHNDGMKKYISTGKSNIIGSTVEVIAKRKNGNHFPVELSLSSWEEYDNKYVCGIIRDISSRKRNEREILDLHRIIDCSPSCLKLVNSEGKLLKMNNVGLNLIEADSFIEVDGASVYDLVHEEDRETFIKFNELICSGNNGSLIFKIVGLKGTTRTMETFACYHKLSSGEITHLAITNDISDRIKTEKESLEKDQKLEETKRLSVIGEFAAGIAHEVNNPLAIIQSKSQLIQLILDQKDSGNEEDLDLIQNSLNVICETVEHTSDLIKNLKAFSSKVNFEKMDQVYLLDIVKSTLKISEKRCQNTGISVVSKIDPDTTVLCNPVGLSQVLMNLLINSIDAISNSQEKWIKIEASSDKSNTKLIITDSGKGISKNIAPKIMHPFFSTKEPGKGTGLGLSISLKSIEKMNGQLYYNQKSKNTQFIIDLKNGK